MKRLIPVFFISGCIMALAGAAIYITGWRLAPYLYTAGAVLFAIAQICSPDRYQTSNLRRLRAQQVIAAFLLVVAGLLMFLTRGNEWIVCLTIAAVMELYTAIRIPQEEEKAKNVTRQN